MEEMTQAEIDAIMKGMGVGSDTEENAGDEQAAPNAMGNATPEQVAQPNAAPAAGAVPPPNPQLNTFQTNAAPPPGMAPAESGNIGILLDIPLNVSVELGRAKLAVKDMLQLGPGSVIELDKLIGEPVDLLVNEKLIAKGEVVVFDDSFGVRITDILNPEDRIRGLG